MVKKTEGPDRPHELTWTTVLISITTGILGVFAGPLLEKWVRPLTDAQNLPPTLFALFTFVFLVMVLLWDSTRKDVADTSEQTALLSSYIGQMAAVVHPAEGFKRLYERGKTAKEALVFTSYIFDWENGKSLYSDEIIHSRPRVQVHNMAIARAQDPNDRLKYIRIVAVPNGHSIEEVFPHDPVFENYCTSLGRLGKVEPERVSLRVTHISFHNTFVILDGTFLYMEFDTFDPVTQRVGKNFTMIVDDPKSIVVQELSRFHQRLQAHSVLYLPD